MKKGDIVYYFSDERFRSKKPVIFQAEFVKFIRKDIVEIYFMDPVFSLNNETKSYEKSKTNADVNCVFTTHQEALTYLIGYLEEKNLFVDHFKKYNEWLPKKQAEDEQKKKSAEYAKKVGVLGLEYVFTFGKYKNCTLETVVDENPSYVCWLNDKTDFKVDPEVYKFCKQQKSIYVGGGYTGWENISDLEQDAYIQRF
jgi:hypothetical protein